MALNQTFYTIYSNLSLKELFIKLIDWIKGLITSGKGKEIVDEITEDVTKEETTEESTEDTTESGEETKE